MWKEDKRKKESERIGKFHTENNKRKEVKNKSK